MTYTIYGLRLRGEPEMRYVGRTAKSLTTRLYGHRWASRMAGTNFGVWLNDNADAVEIVPLMSCEGWGEIKKAEAAAIALCLAMGHRLFNQWLVPAELRSVA